MAMLEDWKPKNMVYAKSLVAQLVDTSWHVHDIQGPSLLLGNYNYKKK